MARIVAGQQQEASICRTLPNLLILMIPTPSGARLDPPKSPDTPAGLLALRVETMVRFSLVSGHDYTWRWRSNYRHAPLPFEQPRAL